MLLFLCRNRNNIFSEFFKDVKLEGYNRPELEKVTIEASCPTGFEGAVADEVKKRLNGENVIEIMGRVLFDVPIQDLKKVMELRTVDHIFVIIGATMGMCRINNCNFFFYFFLLFLLFFIKTNCRTGFIPARRTEFGYLNRLCFGQN